MHFGLVSSTLNISKKNVHISLHRNCAHVVHMLLIPVLQNLTLASSAFCNYHRHFIFPRYHQHFTVFIGNTLNINFWISRCRALLSRSLRSLTPLLSTSHDRTRAPFSLTNFVRLDLACPLQSSHSALQRF